MDFQITNNFDDKRIITFLLNNNRASIYHHPAWLKAISQAYNYPAYYIILENSSSKEISGLMPFFVKESLSPSKTKVCSPSTTYIDPLFPEGFDHNLLITELRKSFGDRLQFDFKFRTNPVINNFNTSSDYYNHVIKLGSTIDETYKALGRRSIRRYIKKAEEYKLNLRFGSTGYDLNIFYRLETDLRKSIGLPPAPFYFFYSIWSSLKKNNLIMLPIIEYNSIPIAASIVLNFKDTFYFEYTALDKKYLDLYPNHKLHWDIIKLAQTEYNAKFIDMGRTAIDQQSLIYFKEKWNAKPIPLYRYKFPGQGVNNSKNGLLFHFFKSCNKYMPKKLLELEGKILFKYFD